MKCMPNNPSDQIRLDRTSTNNLQRERGSEREERTAGLRITPGESLRELLQCEQSVKVNFRNHGRQ